MPSPTQPIILFDGVCNFCSGIVNFIIRQDKQRRFRFAALQSKAGQQLLAQFQLPQTSFNSFLLIDNGKVYQRSTAALHLLKILPWYWRWTQVFWLAPTFVGDGVYNFIAKNRYKWFGKQEACMVPSADAKSRFLS